MISIENVCLRAAGLDYAPANKNKFKLLRVTVDNDIKNILKLCLASQQISFVKDIYTTNSLKLDLNSSFIPLNV